MSLFLLFYFYYQFVVPKQQTSLRCFVNIQRGIQRRGQDFNKKKFVLEEVHSKQFDSRISREKLEKRGVNKL